MPPTKSTQYRSISCRIGTHHECAHSDPAAAPIDVPVIYEACTCSCHEPTAQPAPTEATA
ncbi:hypothetical protein ABZV60_05760 [Streptomyces sp. NPDC004787]|uniref:hypothetical protein n=1 Tax=Streptomyces sp. NPDC004787 TaxID=3154291 RepID=UPI0033B3A782